MEISAIRRRAHEIEPAQHRDKINASNKVTRTKRLKFSLQISEMPNVGTCVMCLLQCEPSRASRHQKYGDILSRKC